MPDAMNRPETPDVERLQAGLRTTLENHFGPGITVARRESHVHASTNALEIVTCRMVDGSTVRIVCKYHPGWTHPSFGHRGGIPHEARMYREVLQSLGTSTPAFHGYHTDAEEKGWLCLEYVEVGMRLNMTPLPGALGQVGRWLGEFHAAADKAFSRGAPAFLTRHDEAYYAGWAERAKLLARMAEREFDWFDRLCDGFHDFASALLNAPATCVHGEFYPHNILVAEKRICPVDWESAALAAGEVDLASLTQGWPHEQVQSCEDAYQQARWPRGAPPGFERRIAAARAYWHLRWLGEKPSWARRKEALVHFEHLQALGERWELV